MKFIIDAQLPFLLKNVLEEIGHKAFHVNSLPKGDESSDKEIMVYADEHDLILITKDSDFFYANRPFNISQKLVLVTTRSTKNNELFSLFRKNHELIHMLFKTNNFIEINNNGIVSHD